MSMTDCDCTLSAIRVLMRIEQLESVAVKLETSLEVMESAESRCLAVLNCAICRQRRFSLASITVVCASVIEWIRRVCLRDHVANNAVSLGNFELDAGDAETLSRELMSLHLSRFLHVTTQLKDSLSTSPFVQTGVYLDVVHASLQQLRGCTQRVRDLAASDQPGLPGL